MLMTRASRLAIAALIELADLGPQEWITAKAMWRWSICVCSVGHGMGSVSPDSTSLQKGAEPFCDR